MVNEHEQHLGTERLQAFVEGALDAPERSRAEAHLGTCGPEFVPGYEVRGRARITCRSKGERGAFGALIRLKACFSTST